jgi:hypothetical protein
MLIMDILFSHYYKGVMPDVEYCSEADPLIYMEYIMGCKFHIMEWVRYRIRVAEKVMMAGEEIAIQIMDFII